VCLSASRVRRARARFARRGGILSRRGMVPGWLSATTPGTQLLQMRPLTRAASRYPLGYATFVDGDLERSIPSREVRKTSADDEEQLAARPPRRQILERGACFLERIAATVADLELAARDPVEDVAGAVEPLASGPGVMNEPP